MVHNGLMQSERLTSSANRADRETDAAPTEWLKGGDAAIRWQTLQDLLDGSPEAVRLERVRVADSGWGQRLLQYQGSDGRWAGGKHGRGLYGPKWTSTAYTLLLLRRLGLQPGHPQAMEGVKLLWDHARYVDGGLTPAITIDAPEACVTSMYVALARYFGFDDPRVDTALDWLLANQLPDGGWNCRTVRFGDRHSSFHTSISALEAVAEAMDLEPNRSDLAEAINRGTGFFLDHRLYKSHRTGAVVDDAMTRLSFPPRWRYDILRGLDFFAAVDSPWDDRFTDALAVLAGRQRRDGRWPVQQKHAGLVWFDMEKTGGPSRWNTLRALRVRRWADRRRNE